MPKEEKTKGFFRLFRFVFQRVYNFLGTVYIFLVQIIGYLHKCICGASLLEKHSDAAVYLTQGYICRNAYGEVDNLQRGGSDYTASLIGAAIGAEW